MLLFIFIYKLKLPPPIINSNLKYEIKRKENTVMNYTLENFINFCDDMYIAEEGFKDTKVYKVFEKSSRIK